MDGFSVFIVIVAIVFVAWLLVRSRRRSAKMMEDAPSTAVGAGLGTGKDLFEPGATHHAPVLSFHVHGEEAIVAFDVPLGDEEDEVLNGILADEAVEVVREKRHSLPIDGVTEVVAIAGRDNPREVGRRTLPAPGELPPPIVEAGLSFTHIAHDPFAAPFEEHSDHSVMYETKADVPADELGPLMDEITLPAGLVRGLRATGTDPKDIDAPDLILGLLRMFGYGVTEHTNADTYMAIKDGQSIYILTEPHVKGSHPELDEKVIRRFVAEYGSSGAERGMLITGKYSPFMIHEIEGRQPNLRFITRERLQSFIERMALG